MKKMVFLILHYQVIEETLKCVESIENINYKNKEIIIVDNNSPNDTGKQLMKKFKDKKNMHVILSSKNLGFAKGNNIGFEYAKKELKADFIIMCNNDVYIIQENFCELINKEYTNSSFAILGPRIILNNNTICTYDDKMPTIKELKKHKLITKVFYFFNKIHLRYIYTCINKIISSLRKKDIINTSIRKEDVVINGCCIIFSKKYIEKFDGLDDRTFLYYEEPLLYLKIKRNNLKSVYNPDLIVFHNEGIATSKSITNKTKRIEYKLKHEINSLDILINELDDRKEK